jgi:hypothetical protein
MAQKCLITGVATRLAGRESATALGDGVLCPYVTAFAVAQNALVWAQCTPKRG